MIPTPTPAGRPPRASIRRRFRSALLGLVVSIGALAVLLFWLSAESDRQRRAGVAHRRHVDLIEQLADTFRQTVAINDYVVAGDKSKFVHYDELHRDALGLVDETRQFIARHDGVEVPAELLDAGGESGSELAAASGRWPTEEEQLTDVVRLAVELRTATAGIASLADPIGDPLVTDLIDRADRAAVRIVTLIEVMRDQAERHFWQAEARAAREMRLARRAAIAILLVALSLGAYVLGLLSRRVVAPLVRLSGEIERIRDAADLEKRVAVPGSDELGRVAGEFNALLQRLQEGRQALARSREWVRTFDAITDLVYLTDHEFRIVAANRALAEHLGVDADAVTGMRCGEAFVGCQDCPYPRMVAEDREISIEVDSPDTGRIYELTVTPLRDDAGAITGSVHVARDVTERKAMQAELLAATRLAVLGGITAGVAHEIGNPLASLATRLRLLEERPEPDFVRASLALLKEQIDRITRTLRGIEQLARPPQAERMPCRINAVVGDAMNLLRFHDAARDSRIRLALAAELPLVLEIKDQLVHVFLNLGLNALEAMPSGGTLTVRTEAADGEVRITFADTGGGISGEARERMVHPLFSTKDRGMGLGLSIVRSIVQAHRGRLEIESESGRGASFRVVLPAHAADPAAVGADGAADD